MEDYKNAIFRSPYNKESICLHKIKKIHCQISVLKDTLRKIKKHGIKIRICIKHTKTKFFHSGQMLFPGFRKIKSIQSIKSIITQSSGQIKIIENKKFPDKRKTRFTEKRLHSFKKGNKLNKMVFFILGINIPCKRFPDQAGPAKGIFTTNKSKVHQSQ